MAVDLHGDAESRFLANNLLTSEDWAQDLDDFLTFDEGITSEELLSNLPEDLKFTLKEDGLGEYGFPDPVPEDLWMESSDSSDSGVHGVTVKTEPLSPVPSSGSDLSLPESLSTECFDFTPQNGRAPASLNVKSEVESRRSACGRQTYLLNSSALILAPQVKIEQSAHCQQQSIHSILNSKIKIKPKPCEGAPNTSVLSSGSDGNQTLVLTPDEFKQLTAQGLLPHPVSENDGVVSPPCSTPGVFPVRTTTLPSTAILPSPPPGSHTTPQSQQENGSNKVLKRQQRMIKNRESASLSRRKKKEYLHTLESKIHAFNTENQRLRQENESLKRQLGVLQVENQLLKTGCKDTSSSPPKTRTCLLAIILMLTLNLAPWSSILVSEGQDRLTAPQIVHTGRHLMSTIDNQPDSPVKGSRWSREKLDQESLMIKIQQFLETEGHTNSSVPKSQSDCPTYYNTTESVRLAEKLAVWMWRHEEEQKRVNHHKKQKTARKKHLSLRKVKAAMNGKYATPQYSQQNNAQYQLQVFHPEDVRRDFLSAIHQRNDTFYVLSFSSDYFLMPATAYNKSTRPKMSLIMPAVVNLNETLQPPEGSVAMMQIDCEVFDTRLIHMKKSSVPHFNHHRNQSRDDFREH